MKKFKINKGFIAQKLGNKLTIFDAEESTLFTFNETASYIFQKLKLGWDIDKIVEMLVLKFKIKEEKAQKDTLNFIKDLKSKKIIKS